MTDSTSPLTKLVGFLAVLFLVAGAAIALGGADDDDAVGRRRVALGDVRLIAIDDCDELLDWYRAVAAATPAGALGGYGNVLYAEEGDMAVARDSVASGAATAAPGAEMAQEDTGGVGGGDGFSTTNVQERGVDEPDTVKTDGDVLVHARSNGIEIVDVGDGEPRLLATVPLEAGSTEIILSGDRVLAVTSAWREDAQAATGAPVSEGDRMIMPVMGKPVTVLTAIDISDPSSPDVVETREVPGSYRSARATGTTARIVVVNSPQLPMPGPAVYDTPDQAAIEQRLEEWKTEAIAAMTLDDWAPATGGDCSSVTRTAQPEGLSTTTIITLDLEGSLDQLDSDSVVADAGTIYASTDRLLIATSRWSQTMQPEGTVSTELHAFDISGEQAGYVGSGAVDGYLLNQFALSATGGYVRVATTQEAPWDEATQTSPSSSSLAVLQEQGDALVEVGRVDGLGPTERIQAVRYIGDVAFVVTFRQTDPLYAIDLSDPTAPRVAGELKINGYSAYLHPIDDDRLLGVGQDATDEGRTLGTQVSTFDVADLSASSRIDAVRIDGGTSAAEWDHRAFLWWDDARTAIIPVEIYPQLECPPNAECIFTEEQSRPYMGAVAFTVDEDGSIVEAGRVTHEGRGAQRDGWYPVVRSVVVGDALYTISDAGVLKSDLSSLADEGFAQFPAPPQGEDKPIDIGDGIGDGTSGSSSGSVEPQPAPDEPVSSEPAPAPEG